MAIRAEIVELDRHTHLGPKSLLQKMDVGERAKFSAIVTAVCNAPTGSFSGGGYWQALHGELRGLFEIRFQGKSPWLYRFFCAVNSREACLYIFAGARKKKGEKLTTRTYAEVLSLAEELTN